jgi:hypothetical protein
VLTVGPVAQREFERGEQDGLAGTRLTRDDVETRLEEYLQTIDDREVSDA